MNHIDELQRQINDIRSRNARVDADKAWEVSRSRKIMIAFLTYIVIVIFFHSAQLPQPMVNAIVPTIGFLLSTITGNLIKKRWMKIVYKK